MNMTTVNTTLRNWTLGIDESNIFWMGFDKQFTSVNTLDREVMEEFSQLIDMAAKNKDVTGVIIYSHKQSGFIAGADITQFTLFKSIAEAETILEVGQSIIAKLENLSIPTVALIDGFCLGGGLELVLACDYLIGTEKARLGLPEVTLGIMPGWGGTVRLPRRIGAPNALNMIMAGRVVSGKAAKAMGLLDVMVPKRQLRRAGVYYIKNKPKKHQLAWWQAAFDYKIPRQIFAYFARKQLNKKVKQAHYPAPYYVLDNWEMLGTKHDTAYAREVKTCGQLFFSETSHNLVRAFFLQEKLKGLAKEIHVAFKHVHVIGGGTMGGDIAAWCALRGFTVTLSDLEAKFLTSALKRAYKLFSEKLKEPHLIRDAMDRLIPDVSGNGLAKADIIIEAVVEDLAIKQNIFCMVEAKARKNAILATNTSSIPLDEINTVLQQPERLVGIHFFNPVHKMKLVEVVSGKSTDQNVINKAIGFVRAIDRLPLPVKSSPGFLVNRILMPYLLESVVLLNEGVSAESIDEAMTDFGMPMGPITLADTVGLDVCLSVAKYLSQYFHTAIPPMLIQHVEKRQLGRKTGEGFYKYDATGRRLAKDTNVKSTMPTSEIANRLVLRLLNEAFICLSEGVVSDADLLDAGMIFGTGFAPFRGGPINYARSQGIEILYQKFVAQQKALGEVTDASKEWRETAAN